MNKATIAGVLTAILALGGLIYVFADGAHFPLYQWPYEALQGLAFFLAFALGVPKKLAHILAVFIALAVLAIGFWVGRTLWRCRLK